MGCPDQITIGKTLVFSITTHNSSTGTVQNADSLPIYRIYDINGNQVWPPDGQPGSMARTDDVNTTGFYGANVAINAENGFNDSANYTVYVEAVVEGDIGAISYEFEVVPVPDYEFNIDTTELIAVIRNYLANVEVRPIKTVVGPAKRSVKEFDLPKRCP